MARPQEALRSSSSEAAAKEAALVAEADRLREALAAEAAAAAEREAALKGALEAAETARKGEGEKGDHLREKYTDLVKKFKAARKQVTPTVKGSTDDFRLRHLFSIFQYFSVFFSIFQSLSLSMA